MTVKEKKIPDIVKFTVEVLICIYSIKHVVNIPSFWN